MIRVVLIKTRKGQAALSARVDHKMTQDDMLKEIKAAIREFKDTDPESFNKHAVDGRFPWEKLFTCFPQELLERHGIELLDCGDIWLEPPEQVVTT